jgi:hypothetical protein
MILSSFTLSEDGGLEEKFHRSFEQPAEIDAVSS